MISAVVWLVAAPPGGAVVGVLIAVPLYGWWMPRAERRRGRRAGRAGTLPRRRRRVFR